MSMRGGYTKRSLATAVLVSLAACAIVALACGAPPPTITTAPASALQMLVVIQGQYTAGADASVTVRFRDTAGRPVELTGGQTLTCNGVAFPGLDHASGLSDATKKHSLDLPRLPEGGAFTFVYTDERARQTTLVVPVASGHLAITSPAAGSTVPIPVPRGALPTVAAVATVTPAPSGADQVSWMSVGYSLPTPPQHAVVTLSGEADCGAASEPFQCGDVLGQDQLATATDTYLLSDATYAGAGGFETFQPGPGRIRLGTAIAWAPDAEGFSAVDVQLLDSALIPVVWEQRAM